MLIPSRLIPSMGASKSATQSPSVHCTLTESLGLMVAAIDLSSARLRFTLSAKSPLVVNDGEMKLLSRIFWDRANFCSSKDATMSTPVDPALHERATSPDPDFKL
uniref:Uncharacterized protein n=1 Tax=Odontella aurita TaxID=265563 RepID=A0A7S4MJ54_9STRA